MTEADEIVFIGYFLPDADFELKNLLKRSIRRTSKVTIVLRKEDKPEYYEAILEENGGSVETAKREISKMSFPCQRYSSLLSANKIGFYYDGLENYFKEKKPG